MSNTKLTPAPPGCMEHTHTPTQTQNDTEIRISVRQCSIRNCLEYVATSKSDTL